MIATELDRLKKAKTDIKAAIEAKGVQVAPEALLDSYPAKIGEIQTGGTETGLNWSGTGYDLEEQKRVLNKMQSDLNYTASLYSTWDPKRTDAGKHYWNNQRLVYCPAIDTSNLTRTSSMFGICKNLTTVPYLETGKVTHMNAMFSACELLVSMPTLNTSSCIDMEGMFSNCYRLDHVPISSASNVENIRHIFYGCKRLTEIPALATSKCRNMNGAFYNCYNVIKVNGLNVSSCIDFGETFYECDNLKEIHLTGTPKPECDITDMFFNVAQNGTLYIPTGKRTEYQRIIDELPSGWSVVEE